MAGAEAAVSVRESSTAELLELALAQLREQGGVPDGPCELRVSFTGGGLRVRKVTVTHWSWQRVFAFGRRQLDLRESKVA